MGKITYWLRKLGILRTASYTAKNVDELNEATATDGGMIQTEKEIAEKHKPEEQSKQKENISAESINANNDNNANGE